MKSENVGLESQSDGLKSEGSELPEKKRPWYKFDAKKGPYLLGTIIAFVAYGSYMAQTPPQVDNDISGVSSFIRCSSSLNGGAFDESACRKYFEGYLTERISKTNNLPKIISIEDIGLTYMAAQDALKEKKGKPLIALDVLTNEKIQVLKSGKIITSS